MKQKQKFRRRTPWALGVLILCLIPLTGCTKTESAGGSGGNATPTPLPTLIVPENPTYTVEVGTVIETLEFTGRASPQQEQELFFQTNGNVGEVYVSRGDTVKTGDLLAELEIDELERQLTQTRLNLETAQLRLEEAQVEAVEAITTTWTKLEQAQASLAQTKITSANDLADARAAVASAETSLKNARLNLAIVQESDTVVKNVRDREYEANWWDVNYGEYLKKYEAGQIDKTRLDLEYNNMLTAKERLATARAQAQLALNEAQAKVTQAEESLRQAKARVTELHAQQTIVDAQTALEQAQRQYEKAVADADPNSYNLRLLWLDLEQTQLDIKDIEDHIASAQLVAPFDGQILSLSIEEGDTVEAYSVVGQLADPTKLEVTAALGSEELSQMAENQEARITLRNRPGQTFSGTVRQLPYPYGSTTVDTGDDTAVHVTVESSVELALGELATVSIILEEKENVLWLPPAAIRTYQGRDFVVVKNPDGTQQRVDVLLGIITDERVEITAGLQVGQVIVGQ